MPLIQAPEITKRLYQRLGIRDRTVAPSLAPEVTPVVLVDDLTVPDFPDTNQRCAAARTSFTGVVAQVAGIYLINPLGSGVRASVRAIGITSAAGAALILAARVVNPFTEAGVGLLAQTAWLNAALQPGLPQLQIGSKTNANPSPLSGALVWDKSDGPILFETDGLVLVPGSCAVITWTSDGATAVHVNFHWFEASERN